MLPAPPPALTCKLPGPWHDSQPMFFAFSPLAIRRACVAVRKSRTISSWQVRHSSEPTNSAPGMLGGVRIVLFVVLHESRITASAAVPPAPQSSFSRSPWIHRVSLECHTDGEYCKKERIVTTHFFGKNEWQYFAPESSIQRRFVRFEWIARYAFGDFPESFLKTRLNCESDWNPAAKAISLIRRLEFSRRSRAFSNRARAT